MYLIINMKCVVGVEKHILPSRFARQRTWARGQPKGKENGGVGGGSCPHGMEEKLSSPPPTLGSGLPCPVYLYTPP
jgi:hypothetical protein